MVTLVIVNVALVVLGLIFGVKEWNLTPTKIKDKVLSAVGGFGCIGGGMNVTRVTPDARSKHGHSVSLNGTLVGVVVREGGSLKVVNPEVAPPVEEPKQERPQQNQPQQNPNNNQPRRDEQRRDERRNDQRRDGRDDRRDQRQQDQRNERRN